MSRARLYDGSDDICFCEDSPFTGFDPVLISEAPTPERNQEYLFLESYFPEYLPLYRQCRHRQSTLHLFTYLWLYKYGGTYSHGTITDTCPEDYDFQYAFDSEGYISPERLSSQPQCGFWLELVSLMQKRCGDYHYSREEEIDRNSGRKLLTEVARHTMYRHSPYLNLTPELTTVPAADTTTDAPTETETTTTTTVNYNNTALWLLLILLVILAMIRI